MSRSTWSSMSRVLSERLIVEVMELMISRCRLFALSAISAALRSVMSRAKAQ